MARLSQGWLCMSLFVLFFQLSLSLVFDEIPGPDVLPSTLQTRADDDFSMLDMLKKDSFYWTGTQNGHLALANLTIDLPGDDETVVSLDRFAHLLRSIDCTNRTMTVGFTNQKAYDHVRKVWNWLNDQDPHKLVVVAGARECGWNAYRVPFYASTIAFNDTSNSATLTGKAIAWREFQNYELTVGNYNPVSGSKLARTLNLHGRDMDESMSLPFDIPLPFPSGQLNTPPGVSDLALTWFCSDCGTKGSFDFGFHIETKLGIPQGASISLTPNSVSTTINSRVAIQADLTGSLGHEWEIGGIPIGGISIPGGILDVGPAITFSLGYSVGPLQGSAGVTSGVTASIPDEAELEIDLLDPDVEASGWDADVQAQDVVLDARIVGDVQIYVKASIELSAEALGQGFEAGINLKPYAGAGLTAQASTDEVCPDSGSNFGVMVYPKAGIALNAAVAKASEPEDPLVEAVIACTAEHSLAYSYSYAYACPDTLSFSSVNVLVYPCHSAGLIEQPSCLSDYHALKHTLVNAIMVSIFPSACSKPAEQ
ncbi:uncharacterized protein BDV14DRAFT_200932 [Aspergillus stella-maris]|uniref:uncharacterized protein n=1 Tax=Aspergillus stella-maris TaxID=1810926 RepID=UPI003CCC9D78